MRTSALFAIVSCLLAASSAGADTYELAFSTYLGGGDWEHGRDVCVDAAGAVYVVGGTTSTDFPTTPGAFQRVHDQSGTQVGSGGYCDAFISKFSPDGQLIWSTLLGGPNYDRAYAVEVAPDGGVIVSGRAGPGFPVTAGAFQTTFSGYYEGIYGWQNGFVAKVAPDGSSLMWASYVGTGQPCRDVDVDADGDVYVPIQYQGSGALPPTSWFANAFQPLPAGGKEIGAAKVAGDGSAVLWATWLGGSANEIGNAGVHVDDNENVFLNFTTQSTNVPTTAGAHDRTHNGGNDAFIAKLSTDGSTLLYGTYFGGSGNEAGNSTHNLAVDAAGDAYLTTFTTSTNIPVTAGAFQSAYAGGATDVVAAKFSPDGALLACTYLGGSGDDGPDGVDVDDDGRVFFTGNTSSADFPITPETAYQTTRATIRDAILVVLKPDFTGLAFGSFMGGASYDDGRGCCLDDAGGLYLTGSTNGSGWPTLNAWQDTFAGGGGGQELCYEGGCYAGDVILAKFDHVPTPLPGDANGDGTVNINDFVILKNNFGTTTTKGAAEGDFNGDGAVDINDFVVLKNNFGAGG